MNERAKLDRKLFDAAVNAYRVVPSVLRGVAAKAIAKNQATLGPVSATTDRDDLAAVEVEIRLMVPLVLLDPALVEELRRNGR